MDQREAAVSAPSSCLILATLWRGKGGLKNRVPHDSRTYSSTQTHARLLNPRVRWGQAMEPQNRKRVPCAAYQVSSAKPAIGSVAFSRQKQTGVMGIGKRVCIPSPVPNQNSRHAGVCLHIPAPRRYRQMNLGACWSARLAWTLSPRSIKDFVSKNIRQTTPEKWDQKLISGLHTHAHIYEYGPPQTHAHACTHTGDKGIPTDDHKVCQFSEKGLAQGVRRTFTEGLLQSRT